VTIDLTTPTRHDLGPLSQIPYGEGRAFAVAEQQIAIFRLRGGGLRAVSAVCPHKGGPIADGQIDGRVVLCPLHLTAFDLATGRSTTNDCSLSTYDVQVVDDRIVLSC